MSTEYPFEGPEAMEEAKSALGYLHEIHQWHDKCSGLTTLLELAVAKEFPGAVTEFHSLSASMNTAFEELRKIVMMSLIDCGRPGNPKEETSEIEDEDTHVNPADLQ